MGWVSKLKRAGTRGTEKHRARGCTLEMKFSFTKNYNKLNGRIQKTETDHRHAKNVY